MNPRKIDVLVLSDIHLGTYGCHAKELLRYLRSVDPRKVILNGDIIDTWNFSRWYWPESHMAVIEHLISWITSGKEIIYLTGNHDDVLRKFSDLKLSNFRLADKWVLDLGVKKAWIFHGDVFDLSVKHARWLAKLGGKGYEVLIVLNRILNWFLLKAGRSKYSLSRKIKYSVKQAVSFVSDFEKTATDLAIRNGFDYVICGHIHQPAIRDVFSSHGKTIYLNSGDWIENLSALEYFDNSWHLYFYEEDLLMKQRESIVVKMETRERIYA